MGFIYGTKSLECLFCICLETPDEIDKIVFPRMILGLK